MRLSTVFRKPRWQSKDPRTRLAAVAGDSDGELLSSLGRIAREDTEAQVRLAAMKRLADPGIAHGMAHYDADEVVRAQARSLWRDLLAGVHASAPPLSERLRLLEAQDDPALLEWIARNGREATLRRAALVRTTRPGLLVERAIEDGDAGLRLELVERIDDEQQLARLAERARKVDKQLSRRARERIDTLKLARGDEGAIEQRARQLCERLERLLREPGGDGAEETAVAQAWSALGAGVPPALQARHAAACSLLAASRMPHAPVSIVPTSSAPGDVQHVAPAEDDDGARNHDAAPADVEPEAVIAPLLAQARFAASLDEARAESARRREREQALTAELDLAEHELAAALDAGSTARAHALKARVDALRARIEPLPRGLALRLAASEARYGEVVRWQHWADDQRRRQLCEEVEALPGAGLHPDAVAAKVRDAQAEWARLDAIEGALATRGGGFGRRFHVACRAAFAPTQTYFRKRQELRAAHARATLDLLARAEAAPEAGEDRNALASLRREVGAALHSLDRVDPRERKQLAHRLKDALAALDARVSACDATVERDKAALIDEATQLGQPGQHGVAAAARELQKRWQQAGQGRRARDQEQWLAFRAALDAAFGRLDEARRERSARERVQHEEALGLCVELEAVAADPGGARAALARIQQAWDALRVSDDTLLRRFASARGLLAEADARRERARRTARFDTWRERYRLCRRLEDSPGEALPLGEHRDSLPPAGVAAAALDVRWETALQGGARVEAGSEAHAQVLRALEWLGGLDSPAEEAERRRELQVARLAARLRGDVAPPVADETADLLSRWTSLAPAPSLDARFERALDAVLASLP
jgi:DNA repair protein SbcC/Rad50